MRALFLLSFEDDRFRGAKIHRCLKLGQRFCFSNPALQLRDFDYRSGYFLMDGISVPDQGPVTWCGRVSPSLFFYTSWGGSPFKNSFAQICDRCKASRMEGAPILLQSQPGLTSLFSYLTVIFLASQHLHTVFSNSLDFGFWRLGKGPKLILSTCLQQGTNVIPDWWSLMCSIKRPT